MTYLPKSKYKTKYTNGGEFRLQGGSSSYKGNYIELIDGGYYAGDNLNNLGEKLTKISPTEGLNINLNNPNNIKYSLLKPSLTEEQSKFSTIISTNPKPTLNDYNEGYFNRYIAVKVNTKEYTEVSQETALDLKAGKHDKYLYSVVTIKWSLKSNNIEVNSKYLLDLEVYLPGISNLFPDTGQYQLNNGVIFLNKGNLSRIYPNGTIIPTKLPISYKINSESTTKCANCIFNRKFYCENWDTDIKNNYSCSSFKEKSKNT